MLWYFAVGLMYQLTVILTQSYLITEADNINAYSRNCMSLSPFAFLGHDSAPCLFSFWQWCSTTPPAPLRNCVSKPRPSCFFHICEAEHRWRATPTRPGNSLSRRRRQIANPIGTLVTVSVPSALLVGAHVSLHAKVESGSLIFLFNRSTSLFSVCISGLVICSTQELAYLGGVPSLLPLQTKERTFFSLMLPLFKNLFKTLIGYLKV